MGVVPGHFPKGMFSCCFFQHATIMKSHKPITKTICHYFLGCLRHTISLASTMYTSVVARCSGKLRAPYTHVQCLPGVLVGVYRFICPSTSVTNTSRLHFTPPHLLTLHPCILTPVTPPYRINYPLPPFHTRISQQSGIPACNTKLKCDVQRIFVCTSTSCNT